MSCAIAHGGSPGRWEEGWPTEVVARTPSTWRAAARDGRSQAGDPTPLV